MRSHAVEGCLDEDGREDQSAGQRGHAAQEKIARAEEECLSEVEDAGEGGQPVVKTNHHTEGQNRVGQHMVAHDVHDRIKSARDHPGHDGGVAGRAVFGMDPSKTFGDGAVVTHGEQSAGWTDEGGLQRSHRTRQHGERHEHGERSHDRHGHFREDIFARLGIGQPEACLAETGEAHGGNRDGKVERENDENDQCRGATRRLGALRRFLIEREAHIPTPVDEDGKRKPGGESGGRIDSEGIEPIPRESQRRRIARRTPSGDRIPDQDHNLQQHERVLHGFGRGGPAVTDPHRGGHEDKAGHDIDPEMIRPIRDRGDAENFRKQEVEKFHRDAGEVGEHDDGGRDQTPPAEPADVRTEGFGRPSERRPAVRRIGIQFAVTQGNEQHGNETYEENGGHLRADHEGGRTDRRGEGVSRGDGRDPEGHDGRQAHGSRGEALATEFAWDLFRHTSSGSGNRPEPPPPPCHSAPSC